MPYLIDGHNLIPKLGLHLDSADDESILLASLQGFCAQHKTQVEVYFDGAPPGFPLARKSGAVMAYFIRRGSSADEAIEARLVRLGRQALHWVVVSSDRRVQRAARAFQAKAISCEEFASLMKPVEPSRMDKEKEVEQEPSPSPEEVAEWLALFKRRRPRNSK